MKLRYLKKCSKKIIQYLFFSKNCNVVLQYLFEEKKVTGNK